MTQEAFELLVDAQLGPAIAREVDVELAAVPARSPAELLAAVRAAAPARRRRTRARAAAAAVVAAGLAAAVVWGVSGVPGRERGSSPVSRNSPAPTVTPSPHPSTPALGSRTTGTLGPDDVIGGIPDDPVSDTGPYAVVPRIPAGIIWGAGPATLRARARHVLPAPKGAPKGTTGGYPDPVAFPFPAQAVIQPADFGLPELYVDFAGQGLHVRPQGVPSCSDSADPGSSSMVAGLSIDLSTLQGGPQSPDPVTEVIAAFQGDGAQRAVRAAASLSRCHMLGHPLTALPAAQLPGDQAYAGVGRQPAGGVGGPMEWEFVGMARAGQVTVSISFTSGASHAATTARGLHLLQAAVDRVQAPLVQDLVARYVR